MSLNAARIIVLLLTVSSSVESQELSRVKRFFSFFKLVQFPNEECKGKMNTNGTCYTMEECGRRGGASAGVCAQGYGVCCVFVKSCHNRTQESLVYFTNPSHPKKDTAADYCDLTIEITDPDVCQVRIDFISFEIDPPSTGECNRDRFSVTGASANNLGIGLLCGKNNDQHLYVDIVPVRRPQTITLVFITDSTDDYQWQIRTNQINCKKDNKGLRAPNSCRQYFTGTTGVISSFNFGEYTNNQDYAVCIRRDPKTCAVKYSAVEADWTLDTTGDKAKSGVGTTQCAQDFVMIAEGSATGDGGTVDRYCGGRLNPVGQEDADGDVISKTRGPIIVRFHSDSLHEATAKEGFRLTYLQQSNSC